MTVSVTLRRRKTALRGITPAKLYEFFNNQMVLHGYVDSSSSSSGSTNVISDIKCNAANRDLWIVDIINKEVASDFEELIADLTGWSVVSTIDGGGDAKEEEKPSHHHHRHHHKTSTIGGMKTNLVLCNPSRTASGNRSLSTTCPESKALDHRRQEDRISGSKRRSDDCYSSRSGSSTHHHANGLHLLSSLVGDERKILKTVSYSSQESSCISETRSPSSEEEATMKTSSKRLRLVLEEKEVGDKTTNVVAASSSLSSSEVHQSAANALMAYKNSKDKMQSDRSVTCNRPFEMPRPNQSSSYVATQGRLHPNEKPVYSVAAFPHPPPPLIPTLSTRQRHDAKGENNSNRSASNDTNTTCVASENEATGSIQKLYSLMVEQQPSVNDKDDSIGKGGGSGAKIVDGLKGHQCMKEKRVKEEKSCGVKSAAAAAIVVNNDDAGDRNGMKTSRTGETNSSSSAAAAASMPGSHNPSDPSSPLFDRQKYSQKILQQRSELKQLYQLRELDQFRYKRDIRKLVDENLKWKKFSRELDDKYETTHCKYQRYKQLYAISRSKLNQVKKNWKEQNIEITTMKTTIELLQYQLKLQQAELARKAASTKLAESLDFADTCQRKYHDTVQKMSLQGQELQQEREKRIEAETRARHAPKQD